MKKKLVLGLTALVVTSAVAIGGTLAFMTAQTGEKVNTFTAIGENVSGQIKETNWDGLDFDGLAHNHQTVPILGNVKASAMTPGMDIPKDPMLKNTSPISVYMAIKITYSNKAAFDNIAELRNANNQPGVNSEWVESSTGSGIYIYSNPDKTPKAVGIADDAARTTTALFNSVSIKSDAVKDSTNSSHDLSINQFVITVNGAAIQATDIDPNVAVTQLVNKLSPVA